MFKPVPAEDANDVVVVGYARTPMGSLGGKLSSVSALELGSVAIRAALERAGVPPNQVNEVFMGNVLAAGLGQAPCKQAAHGAGIPWEVPCTLVNKVCASGTKACMLGAQAIKLGEADVVVCGGFESMSQVPFYSNTTRFGNKFGSVQMLDGLQKDGLQDAYSGEEMGRSACLCAVELDISREEQDNFAANSYARALDAARNGKFKAEIAPVILRKGHKKVVVETDEEPSLREVNEALLGKLPPAFSLPSASPDELQKSVHAKSVTAGNASVISDGAAAVVLTSRSYASKHGLAVVAVIESWADSSTDPEHFTIAPEIAMKRALERAGRDLGQIGVAEINEAFAVVPLANAKLLGLSLDKINVYGGAVALGHPLGASGCRILCTLISALLQEKLEVGLLGICNGGGGASAMVVSRPLQAQGSL